MSTDSAAGDWQPSIYARFADARLRPAADLIAHISLDAPERIVDLGCGVGGPTALLAARWPAAAITGIDSSPVMLAEARRIVEATWIEADIATFEPDGPVDLVLSNAALQWVDRHERLFPRLLGWLAPGGVLAVQMPRNFEAPSHVALRETAADGPWAGRLMPELRVRPVLGPERYIELIAPHVRTFDVWETVYHHVLEGPDPVLRWTEATALRPLLAALDDEGERARFRAAYAARLRAAYPPLDGGRTVFPFRRLFIVASV